jgi:predicted AlkP superfamily phosphohydrolase/phosphomutase
VTVNTPDLPRKHGSRKLLVLALDAAEPTLLRSWADDGTLPNIAALMAEGLSARTRSVEALFVGATWPSFATGVNPGEHGFCWIDRLVPGTYRTRTAGPADLARRMTLWEILAKAGRRSLVLDVPLSRPSGISTGIQVVEWGVHDALFGFQTEPPAVANEILATVGAHPAPANCDADHRTAAESRAFADQLARGARARSVLTRALLAREPWDFAIQVFSESHCAGHQLWHFHDPSHPAYDPAITAREGDLVRLVYCAIDEAVGEIVRAVDRNTTIVLMALHGMSCMAGSGPLLNDILARLGVMTPGSGEPGVMAPTRPPAPLSLTSRMVRAVRSSYRRIPERIRRPLYDARERIGRNWLGRGVPLNIDPARSHCFKYDLGPAVSGIRLNLVGREPEGLLQPGDAAERFCAQLTGELLELVDPDSGRRLVRRVSRKEELFHGARMDDLPDLFVEWDLDCPVGTVGAGEGRNAMMKAWSPRIGLIEMPNRTGRTGEHRIGGMIVARGPGIAPGELSREVSTLDLAPTFARMLDCEMPDVDGRPVEELLRS